MWVQGPQIPQGGGRRGIPPCDGRVTHTPCIGPARATGASAGAEPAATWPASQAASQLRPPSASHSLSWVAPCRYHGRWSLLPSAHHASGAGSSRCRRRRQTSWRRTSSPWGCWPCCLGHRTSSGCRCRRWPRAARSPHRCCAPSSPLSSSWASSQDHGRERGFRRG